MSLVEKGDLFARYKDIDLEPFPEVPVSFRTPDAGTACRQWCRDHPVISFSASLFRVRFVDNKHLSEIVKLLRSKFGVRAVQIWFKPHLHDGIFVPGEASVVLGPQKS